MCFVVEFDLLFALSVLSCRILDCASVFAYVHEHDRLCFPMLTVETAVFDCICWLRSSRDRKGQSYPAEYCLESVEECSECTIHKGEPEPRKGNVNTVYFINQARANTRHSHGVCLRWRHAIANGYLYLSFLLRIMFVKNILLQISFYAKLKLMWEYLARNLWADVNILVLWLYFWVYGNWGRHAT